VNKLTEKLRSDNLLVNEDISSQLIRQLDCMSDEIVITFFRNSLSILATRMMREDDLEINEDTEEEWISYHRKALGLILESLDE